MCSKQSQVIPQLLPVHDQSVEHLYGIYGHVELPTKIFEDGSPIFTLLTFDNERLLLPSGARRVAFCLHKALILPRILGLHVREPQSFVIIFQQEELFSG